MSAPGTLGSLTRSAALSWVRDNIAASRRRSECGVHRGGVRGAMSVGTLLTTDAAKVCSIGHHAERHARRSAAPGVRSKLPPTYFSELGLEWTRAGGRPAVRTAGAQPVGAAGPGRYPSAVSVVYRDRQLVCLVTRSSMRWFSARTRWRPSGRGPVRRFRS